MGYIKNAFLCFGLGLFILLCVPSVHSQTSTRDRVIANLTKVVHFVVGPSAEPNEDLINLAFTIGGSPKTPEERTKYLGILKQIARKTPDVTKEFMTPLTLPDGSTFELLDNDALDSHISMRAMMYVQKQRKEKMVAAMAAVVTTKTPVSDTPSTKGPVVLVSDFNMTSLSPTNRTETRIGLAAPSNVVHSTATPLILNNLRQQRQRPTQSPGATSSVTSSAVVSLSTTTEPALIPANIASSASRNQFVHLLKQRKQQVVKPDVASFLTPSAEIPFNNVHAASPVGTNQFVHLQQRRQKLSSKPDATGVLASSATEEASMVTPVKSNQTKPASSNQRVHILQQIKSPRTSLELNVGASELTNQLTLLNLNTLRNQATQTPNFASSATSSQTMYNLNQRMEPTLKPDVDVMISSQGNKMTHILQQRGEPTPSPEMHVMLSANQLEHILQHRKQPKPRPEVIVPPSAQTNQLDQTLQQLHQRTPKPDVSVQLPTETTHFGNLLTQGVQPSQSTDGSMGLLDMLSTEQVSNPFNQLNNYMTTNSMFMF